MTDVLVHDATELVVGPDKGSLNRIENGAVAIEDGTVVAVGPTETVRSQHPNATQCIDASGQTVLPGFVDPHTHALFAGDRSDEFVARIEGKSYNEIMDAGGGIAVTVEAIRETSDEELLANLLAQLDVMLEHGTTTAEVKSGYGLDTQTELRMLDTIQTADEQHPIDLIPTFMGAHAVPAEMETDAYVEEVVEEQLPAVAEQGVAEFCDVFCEEGVFDVEQSRRILVAGREHGLDPKIHAEEFTRIGGAQLAAELEAASADHLLSANEADANSLVEAGVVPTLLPATAFSLDEPYADAETFLDVDAPVALGSDLNPSCFVHSMGLVVSLACLRMKMQPDEAVLGATANAAAAIGQADGVGTLQEGTQADLTIFDLPSLVHIPYNAGTNRVEKVLKAGELVVDDGQRTGRSVATQEVPDDE
ncbi:imidazolonepropionase [Halovenus rubra]|uniref:Imidazolonepropionase n=2 Tax=Halovenus rubra TaxID=869890 RepID=A0ABD5X295_9EURY|nr:imidazolonepropionase [Halovenus rubra]